MPIDRDDIETLAAWGLRFALVLTGAAVAGLAVRIFALTSGFGG